MKLRVSRAGLHWIELGVVVTLVLGVLVLVNYIAYRHNLRFDLTPQKSYSLSAHTRSVMDSLSDELTVTLFYRHRERDEMLELAELFSRASDYFHCTFLDLDKNPARAKALGITSYGSGLVEYQGRQERLQHFSEEDLCSAVIRLTEKGAKIVRFVRGHGEKDLGGSDPHNGYGQITGEMEAENFVVSDFLLLQADRVPDDTLVLVIAGPQKDYFEREIELIGDYLRSGGRVLLLCDPVRLPRLAAWVQGFNLQLSNDFIVDTKSKLMALDALTPLVMPERTHPVGASMNQAVVLPYCRSVLPREDTGDEPVPEVLARSGPQSWAERDYQSVYDGSPAFDAGDDLRGPVPVAAAVPVAGPQAEGLLVVFGDSDFVNDHYLTILGNRDLFLNTLNWMTGTSSLLSQRRAAPGSPVSILFLTENESRLVLWTSVAVQPALVLLIGVAVVLWRRMRR